jgi:phage shock protein A
MAMMLSRTYEALLAAGAPEDKAREAAEELAGYENRLASIDNRLSNVEGKLTVIIWAAGINAAATIAILGVLLRHGG